MKKVFAILLLLYFIQIGCVGTAANSISSPTQASSSDLEDQKVQEAESSVNSAGLKVWLKVLIDENGKVEDVELYKTSGDPSLDEEVIDWSKQVIFAPPQRDGISVKEWYIWPITLKRQKEP